MLHNKFNFIVLPNGKLEINLTDIDADTLAEMQAFEGTDDDFLWQFFEPYFCNGLHLVNPNYKGLTEAPMISDEIIDEETTEAQMEAANVWYFDNYQIESVQSVLIRDGKVILNKV